MSHVQLGLAQTEDEQTNVCGIAGRWNLDGQPVDPEKISEMAQLLRHRGPDAQATHCDGPLGLAHARLSIIDLSDLGRQPMSNSNGSIWIAFNGEIYNFLQLRAELERSGYPFRSKTDTEVILALYEKEGESCFEKLDGMFALAIWDSRDGALVLARDRLGKKPLYYYRSGSSLIFGSELKALLAHADIDRAVEPAALCDFVTYGFVPDPKSIFAGIEKLKPGHSLRVHPDGDQERCYWDLKFGAVQQRSEQEWAEGLVEHLKQAVADRMISDVPLGAFLSGGIDSGAIVAMMAQAKSDPVITASIGFEEEAFNELPYARLVAERYETDHHEDIVRYDTFEDMLEILLWHFEEPFCDESAIATYYLSRLARKHVTVALSGDGGDEGFAGYTKYSQLMQEENWRRKAPGIGAAKMLLPLLQSRLAANVNGNFSRAANFIESVAAERSRRIHLANAHLRDHERNRLFAPELRRKLGGYSSEQQIADHLSRVDSDDYLAGILYVDTKFLLPGDFLVKVDRMSMANSLEVRCPFLDHRLLEFAAEMPSSMKIQDGEKKYVLKKALEPYLPHEILYRKKKGFDVPIDGWFAKSLRGYVEKELTEDDGLLASYFDGDTIRTFWKEFLDGRKGHKSLIWNLLMFKLWHKKWIGQPVTAAVGA